MQRSCCSLQGICACSASLQHACSTAAPCQVAPNVHSPAGTKCKLCCCHQDAHSIAAPCQAALTAHTSAGGKRRLCRFLEAQAVQTPRPGCLNSRQSCRQQMRALLIYQSPGSDAAPARLPELHTSLQVAGAGSDPLPGHMQCWCPLQGRLESTLSCRWEALKLVSRRWDLNSGSRRLCSSVHAPPVLLLCC